MSDPSRPVLERVLAVIRERRAGQGATSPTGRSYVRTLMDQGTDKINEKIAEEAAELCRALRRESDERVAEEAADLLFHVLVGLAHRDVDLAAIEAVLLGRLGTSGIDEKAGRD
jgi:phosphoribosyl-ATP pyrophosphohydrolase/phosphoribosyl-AMP cyclohydrolase